MKKETHFPYKKGFFLYIVQCNVHIVKEKYSNAYSIKTKHVNENIFCISWKFPLSTLRFVPYIEYRYMTLSVLFTVREAGFEPGRDHALRRNENLPR